MTTDMLETPCRFWLGPILAIFLGKPEDAQTVLLSAKCQGKPYFYQFLDDNLGLLTGPCWFTQNECFFIVAIQKLSFNFSTYMETTTEVIESNIQQQNFTIILTDFQRKITNTG